MEVVSLILGPTLTSRPCWHARSSILVLEYTSSMSESCTVHDGGISTMSATSVSISAFSIPLLSHLANPAHMDGCACSVLIGFV